MQAGMLVTSRSRYLSYLGVTIGIVLINLAMWVWIIVDAINQRGHSTASLLMTALASTAAIALTVSLWRSPLSTNHRMLQTPALRHALATHHAGHIVAAHGMSPDRIRRVSLTEPCNHHRSTVPVITESALHAELTVALGGTAADEIFSGETGTHAAADLEIATRVATDMVGRYGMAGSPVSLLPLTRRRKKLMTLIVDDIRTRKELETLLRQAKKDTTRLLLEHRHEVVAIRDALLRNQRLSATEITSILASANRIRSREDKVLVDLRIPSGQPAVGAYR